MAALGDVNGDGRRDMIIGAPGAARRCSQDEGAAYVVFSRADPAPLDLVTSARAAMSSAASDVDANAGAAVASAGDWNRDGRADTLVLRTDFDDSTRGRQAPRLDLLLGRDPPPPPRRDPAPQLELLQTSLPAFYSRSGIEARVTVAAGGPGDNVDIVVRSPTRASSRSAPPPCSFRSRAPRR